MPAKGQRTYTDLSGQRFGRWLVIKRVDSDECGHVMYSTLCDCGWKGVVKAYALRNGTSKSCGCLAAELTRETWRKKGKEFYFANRKAQHGISSQTNERSGHRRDNGQLPDSPVPSHTHP